MRTAISYVIFIEILFLLLVDAKSLNLSGKYIPNGRGLQLYKSCARSRALLIPVYIIIIHTFLHTVASSPSPIHSPSLKVGFAFERKKTTVIDPSKGPSRIGLLHNLALSPISVPLHTDETTSCIRNRPSSRQHAEPHASSRRKKWFAEPSLWLWFVLKLCALKRYYDAIPTVPAIALQVLLPNGSSHPNIFSRLQIRTLC